MHLIYMCVYSFRLLALLSTPHSFCCFFLMFGDGVRGGVGWDVDVHLHLEREREATLGDVNVHLHLANWHSNWKPPIFWGGNPREPAVNDGFYIAILVRGYVRATVLQPFDLCQRVGSRCSVSSWTVLRTGPWPAWKLLSALAAVDWSQIHLKGKAPYRG